MTSQQVKRGMELIETIDNLKLNIKQANVFCSESYLTRDCTFKYSHERDGIFIIPAEVAKLIAIITLHSLEEKLKKAELELANL